MDGPIPDYSNEASKHTASTLPDFVYDADLNDGVIVIEKKPAEFENKAIYKGQWTQDGKRHGRGVQFWPDGSKYEGY